MSKNAENGYFDQHLEWAAPKRWSKYTTVVCLCVLERKREREQKRQTDKQTNRQTDRQTIR